MSEIQLLTTEPSPMLILEDVAVRYRVPTERIGTFKEFAIRLITRKVSFRHFWALGGITLTVNKGEV
ncbi:MAG: hypothetical protein WBI14_00840, partial [Anaerolineaceae bacterium]